ERELIAVLELGVEAPGLDPRLERAGAVLVVVELSLPGELAHRLDPLRPRAEARRRVAAPEIVAGDEADLGVEVVAHLQVLGVRAVAIAAVIQLRLVAVVVSLEAGRVGAR